MYQKQSEGWTKHLDFILLDLLCLYISYFFAYYIRHHQIVPLSNQQNRSFLLVLFFIQIMISLFYESFKNVLKRGYYLELTMTVKHTILIVISLTFYLFLIKEGTTFSRITIILMGIFYCIFSYCVRLIWKQYLLKWSTRKMNQASLLIVTSKEIAEQVVLDLKSEQYGRYSLAGLALLAGDPIETEIQGSC